MADDELKAIQAIYCQPGEIAVFCGSEGSKEVKVKLKSTPKHEDNQSLCLDAELRLLLPPAYPAKPPDISVRSDKLTRKDITRLRTVLCENAAQNVNQPMLMELIMSASEELQDIAVDIKIDVQTGSENFDNSKEAVCQHTQNPSAGDEDRLALLHLDHMRAKSQYVKLIKKWTTELALHGLLVFCQRLIVIVLQGPSSSIKEYIVHQRTSNVDVDSRGQPCKERMLSVLCDISATPQHFRFKDFQVVELKKADDMEQFFTRYNLHDLFVEHIKTLKNFPGR